MLSKKENFEKNRDFFVDSCLEDIFEYNAIVQNRDVVVGGDYDVIVSIVGRAIRVDSIGAKLLPALWEHRVGTTMELLKWTLERSELDLNCRFILSPEDDINTGDGPERRGSKIGYSCALDSFDLAIPDPHFLKYIGRSHIDEELQKQLLPLSGQINQAVFRGSDTSAQRVRVSQKSLESPFINSRISNFLDRVDAATFFKGIDKEKILSPWMCPEEQLAYKYILDIYGHTIAWDRPCWSLPSDSVLVSLKPCLNENKEVHTWYSHFAYQEGIIPQVNEKELFASKEWGEYSALRKPQKEFGNLLLHPETLLSFFSKFLFKYNFIYNS